MKFFALSSRLWLIFLSVAGVAQGACPPSRDILPCSCDPNQYAPGLSVDCSNKALTDSQMSSILNALLLQAVSTPVVQLFAQNNALTKIPTQIASFTRLFHVDLSFNKIMAIPPGMFNFPSVTTMTVLLDANKIAAIPSGTFKFPLATTVIIGLGSNQLTSIPAGAFSYPSAIKIKINLPFNQITAVASSAFDFPSGIDIMILLSNNILTSIQSSLFNFVAPAKKILIYINDNKITSVQSGAFNFPFALFQVRVELNSNQITSIQSGTFNCPSATDVRIYLNTNQIASIQSGSFNFPSASTYLMIELKNNLIETVLAGTFNLPNGIKMFIDFSSNKIKTIKPEWGTFPVPTAPAPTAGLWIGLDGNKLIRFESAIFKPVLEKMTGRDLWLFMQTPSQNFDCSTDPCHMAWLIKYNPQLLGRIYNGVCTDGTLFQNLNPANYASCPATC